MSGGANLGASVLVASPRGVAASYRDKVQRLAAEQHLSIEEARSQLHASGDTEAVIAPS